MVKLLDGLLEKPNVESLEQSLDKSLEKSIEEYLYESLEKFRK